MSTSTVHVGLGVLRTRRHPAVGEGHHAADTPYRIVDNGPYEGKHRIDDAQVGSVIVARFHNAPARLVTLSRMEVSA